MTDLEAINQYLAAERYRRIILDERVPEVFDRDPVTRERYRAIMQREINEADAVMDQAVQAIKRLPRPEWREVMANRFMLGLFVFETADAIAYSDRSVYRFEQQAVEYLETCQEPKRRGRAAEGP